MGHSQPPAPVAMAMDKIAANSTMNGTVKQKISRSIDMRFYWVRDRIQQNDFHISWEEGRENLSDYVTKDHPILRHTTMRTRYFKSTKKDIENSKDQRTGTRRGCDGTSNTGIN